MFSRKIRQSKALHDDDVGATELRCAACVKKHFFFFFFFKRDTKAFISHLRPFLEQYCLPGSLLLFLENMISGDDDPSRRLQVGS